MHGEWVPKSSWVVTHQGTCRCFLRQQDLWVQYKHTTFLPVIRSSNILLHPRWYGKTWLVNSDLYILLSFIWTEYRGIHCHKRLNHMLVLNFLFYMFWHLWPPSDISNHKTVWWRIILTEICNDKIRSYSLERK